MKAKAITKNSRLSRVPSKDLHVLGRCSRETCSKVKREVRDIIRGLYPESTQPLSQHPRLAVVAYEGVGYRAPFWLLEKVGVVGRYGKSE